jgi:hypothetical protein
MSTHWSLEFLFSLLFVKELNEKIVMCPIYNTPIAFKTHQLCFVFVFTLSFFVHIKYRYITFLILFLLFIFNAE